MDAEVSRVALDGISKFLTTNFFAQGDPDAEHNLISLCVEYQ